MTTICGWNFEKSQVLAASVHVARDGRISERLTGSSEQTCM
jgi:hypothetical protein